MQLLKFIILAATSSLVGATPISAGAGPLMDDRVVCTANTTTGTETCQVVRAAPESLEARGSHFNKRGPIAAKIYWSNDGYVKMILPWIITPALADSFEGSGYNLGKDMLGEMRSWILANSNLQTQVVASFAEWSGQIDFKGRYLRRLTDISANYVTVAMIAATSNADQAYEIANAMARWFSQGQGAADVMWLKTSAETFGNNPNSKLKKKGLDENRSPAADLHTRGEEFCRVPIHGMFNAGLTQHSPRELFYSFSC